MAVYEIDAHGNTYHKVHRRPIREYRPKLQLIASNKADLAPAVRVGQRFFDVFISHASEDKDVVRPLAYALKARGVNVWYDELVLRVGDSLRRKIDDGISRSRFAIVVLSRSFFTKAWPQRELDGLVAMSVGGQQVMLPIWHGVTEDEVRRNSPSLAGVFALNTADYGVDEIARELTAVINDRE